jgi:glycosyltransferase involved in cell wall biosynthesis
MRTELGLAENEVAIAIIGRLVPVKDHAFFLAAIEKLMDNTSVPVRVFIVGDGTERNRIAQEVERINNRFGERILMTSWITEIAKFNAAMDVICLTSKNEGTPVSLIEAQASGVPVLTTDVGGVRDVVLENETGFIVDVGDLENYVTKLGILVEDEKNRIKMSQNGWNFVRDKFHYTRLVSDMEAYYRELLENKGKK